MHKNVRPICIILSQHENTEAWTFGLATLKKYLDSTMPEYFEDETTYECDYFIADGG